jgi:hypothetical protein
MENFSLMEYLTKSDPAHRYYYDLLKFEIEQRVYYYGDQFMFPKETTRRLEKDIKTFLKIIKMSFDFYQVSTRNERTSKPVVSNAYFTFNTELQSLGYNVYRPIWAFTKNEQCLVTRELGQSYQKLWSAFQDVPLKALLCPEMFEAIRLFESRLKTLFADSKLQALVVPNDIDFFHRLALHIAQELGIPSFIFLHGLPGRYNKFDESRADYLMVWGEAIKRNYINIGFPAEKIIVTGHPYYKKRIPHKLRSTFDDVLVISKSMNGAQHSDEVRLADRGNLILYLLSLQKTLLKVGINKVRLRLHPSENPNWYYKHIDKKCFVLDRSSLSESLGRATLVVGATSTVFLEALYYGVNYIVYEPAVHNIDVMNFPLVPPFDGSDKRVAVAKNEDELEELLRTTRLTDVSIFDDYINMPFNIEQVDRIIQQKNV